MSAASSSSKSRPDALSQFLSRDEAHNTHASLGKQHQSGSGQNSFRQAAQSSSSQFGTDDDFGRFAQPAGSWSAPGGSGSLSIAGAAQAQGIAPPRASDQHQQQAQDGFDVQSLLSSNSLTDAVSGDWASELASSQSQPWRARSDTTLPSDPLTNSSSSSSKGKAREQYSTPGDVSPITSELIASLSHLNVSDQTYLRTLLAQSPDQAITDYFSRGTYADDVWGEPSPAVDAIMEKVKQGEQKGEAQAGAHEKAVRRLAMVARHLANATQAPQAARTNGALASNSVHRQAEGVTLAQATGQEWAGQYPILAQHAPYADFVAREAPVHPAQHSSRFPQKQFRPVHTTPFLNRRVGHVKKVEERRDSRAEDEERPATLGPFSRYFDEKLRQMASLQGAWRSQTV